MAGNNPAHGVDDARVWAVMMRGRYASSPTRCDVRQPSSEASTNGARYSTSNIRTMRPKPLLHLVGNEHHGVLHAFLVGLRTDANGAGHPLIGLC